MAMISKSGSDKIKTLHSPACYAIAGAATIMKTEICLDMRTTNSDIGASFTSVWTTIANVQTWWTWPRQANPGGRCGLLVTSANDESDDDFNQDYM
jgi:hypothetical protein